MDFQIRKTILSANLFDHLVQNPFWNILPRLYSNTDFSAVCINISSGDGRLR